MGAASSAYVFTLSLQCTVRSDRDFYTMEVRKYNDNVAVELDFVHTLIITQYTNSKFFLRPAFLSNLINQVKTACSCEHHTHMEISFFFSLTEGDMPFSETSCSYDEIGGKEFV
jgi:hypothetical protein